MDKKSLVITGLTLSAVVMFCTLVTLDRMASAEVSLIHPSDRANIVASSANIGVGGFENLVILDRSSHKLFAFRFNNAELQRVEGTPIDLAREFARVSGPRVTPGKKTTK